jgi:hypothetical protein
VPGDVNSCVLCADCSRVAVRSVIDHVLDLLDQEEFDRGVGVFDRLCHDDLLAVALQLLGRDYRNRAAAPTSPTTTS